MDWGDDWRIADLHRRVSIIEATKEPLPPLGCICPPKSEQTCKGLQCPRREVRLGSANRFGL